MIVRLNIEWVSIIRTILFINKTRLVCQGVRFRMICNWKVFPFLKSKLYVNDDTFNNLLYAPINLIFLLHFVYHLFMISRDVTTQPSLFLLISINLDPKPLREIIDSLPILDYWSRETTSIVLTFYSNLMNYS